MEVDLRAKYEAENARLKRDHEDAILRLRTEFDIELEEHREQVVRNLSGKTTLDIVDMVRRELR
eukprot:CAMPEP_0185561538 /NCGR_PEP_ID=MMETSP1381-20130426/59410_1 /TAXON_ID=298111 /ORGANISM="Pavlova sp., Strain CCMP459" /LENGTH=63 /DNA_ID=CAMNT_0028175315 /DNA_START=27 /DNA_END=214 /DNA_ORIENTATION=+